MRDRGQPLPHPCVANPAEIGVGEPALGHIYARVRARVRRGRLPGPDQSDAALLSRSSVAT